MTRKILIEIPGAGDVNCDQCENLYLFKTGLVGETRPACDLFNATGNWNGDNMNRPQACLDAEQKEEE